MNKIEIQNEQVGTKYPGGQKFMPPLCIEKQTVRILSVKEVT